MADREKVISGLMHHREKCSINGDFCPYFIDQDECVRKFCDDVLELLKEQEPVKPSRTLSPNGNWWEDCGACDTMLLKWYTYCPNCGRKVKRSATD